MTSLGIRSQANRSFLNFRPPENNARILRPCSIAISRDFDRNKWRIWSAYMKAADEIAVARSNKKRNDGKDKAIVHEKLDLWMKESVVEIVKNLREAPLLVQVFEGGETTTLKTEKAVGEETWPEVMEKWGKKEVPMPEGVIFVEQLEDDGGEGDVGKDNVTRAWGVVVQGRGVDCGPVCYLLKTSRVRGGSGMGVFCTHFCLMKVKNFRESVESQLKNCWLLEG